MKVLMINSSPHKEGCTFTALTEMAKAMKTRGVDSEIYQIGNKPISGCQACGACSKLGKCAISDGVNEIGSRLDEFDALVVGSPVYYAGASGQICSFLDRLFYSHGAKLRGKPGACIVSCRRGGASATFDRLNKYFTINFMPIAASHYWNQVHGNKPEEVLQDVEGMKTVRNLGINLAWLLESIEAGKNNGVPAPNYEAVEKTNFIR